MQLSEGSIIGGVTMDVNKQKQKKRFIGYVAALCVLGISCSFLYTGLETEHMNIIHTFITEEGGGWSASATMLPVTIANLLAIILTFVFGTMLLKYGVRKIMVPFMILTGLSCAGIALANGLDCFGGKAAGSYPLFFASLFVCRCSITAMSLGGTMLVANWIIKYRGRIMSVYGLGAPMFTIVGTSLMPNIISKSWHGDYRPFYFGIGAVCIIMAIVAAIFVRDTPEDAGLYPDGADHPPVSEIGQTSRLTFKEVITDKKAWQIIGVLGSAAFIIAGMMSSMALRFIELGGQELWLSATIYISIGAFVGILFGFVFGILADKIGALKTETLYFIALFIPLFTLLFMPKEKSVLALGILSFGLAIVLGAAAVTYPCIMTHVYGRFNYQAANRITQSIQLIPKAFAGLIMTALIQSGHGNIAYILMIIVCAFGLIVLFTMYKIPDANAADKITTKPKQ